MTTSIVVTKNADPFLHDFVKMFTSNPDMQKSLLWALMQVYVTKLKGKQKNPHLPEKAMNFFIACKSSSRKTFDFMSANFLGPCLRTIQRNNAVSRQPSIICISQSDLEVRLTNHFETLPDYGKETIAIAIGFDGTKVPAILTLSTSTGTIIGGVYPRHAIDVTDMDQIAVKALLDPESDIERAKEIKVAVVTIQNPGIGHSPYFVLAGQPQSINMVSEFNTNITTAVTALCKSRGNASLVSVAADGVGCDAKFIQGQLVQFLRGQVNHVALVDTNHNTKNFRYQAIGGSCVAIMGDHVFDPMLLSLAGVPVELWRVKDWASDLVVLRLASADTVGKLASMYREEVGSVSVLCVTLYFMRLKLFAVNTKRALYRDRIAFLWASLLWLTSFESKSPLGTNQSNMTINKRNLMTESIALVFAMARVDVVKPRYLTTECNEHIFGGWRGQKREATTQECTELEEKRDRKVKAIFASNLKVSRDPQKGYAATFDSFVEVGRVASVGEPGGPVDVNMTDEAAVDLLWNEIGPIINAATTKMTSLLRRFGVKPAAMSPFCRKVESISELLKVYLAKLPKDSGVDMAEGLDNEDNDEDNDENNDEDEVPSARTSSRVDLTSLRELLEEVETERESNPENLDIDSDLEEDGEDDDDEPVGIENVIFGEDGEYGSTTASRKFFSLLAATTMDDMVMAAKNGILCLQLKKNERGSTTGVQKFQSLTGRWYKKDMSSNNDDDTDDIVGGKFIERNTRVQITVKDGCGNSALSAIENNSCFGNLHEV